MGNDTQRNDAHYGTAFIAMMMRTATEKDTVPTGEAVLTGWAVIVAPSLQAAVEHFTKIDIDIDLENAAWDNISGGVRTAVGEGPGEIRVQIVEAPLYVSELPVETKGRVILPPYVM